jgi:hypothetical protein
MINKYTSKNGQAMVEFMLGLVTIMILLMGLNQIAAIVFYDFTTVISAREEVADHLISKAAGTDAVGSDIYNFNSIESFFQSSINPDDELSSEMSSDPSGRGNQFSFLWEGNNPLQEMTSSDKSATIAVTAPLFQRVIGRSTVQINNAVYMPPWESYLND